MNDATALMTRYLLGELSEREQADLETRYFEDPRVFDQLADVENVLIDDYVRGRLAAATRQRFESHFMAHPQRRERVRFAEALIRTVDGATPALEPHGRNDGWASASISSAGASWFDGFRPPSFAMAFATALTLVVVGTWLLSNSRRASEEIAVRPAAEEGRRAGEPAPLPPPGEVRPSPTPPPEAKPALPTPVRPVLATASLALVVGPGERSAEPNQLPTLTIPPGTEQIRFALTLREHDYARYRVMVRAIGGAEVLRQGDLLPATLGAQPAFSITAPAVRFEARDYLLTLQGATGSGDYEDLSQTIFRVVRQP